jgi:hypothetical protein
MKKHSITIWIVLLIVGLTACKKANIDPDSMVDYIQFEGRAYVIGSNLPPKGQPVKLYIYKDTLETNGWTIAIMDSIYTDNLGNFKYKFKPHKEVDRFSLKAILKSRYSTEDIIIPSKLGILKKDIRIIAITPVVLELQNNNFSTTDTLFLTDPRGEKMAYESPINVNRLFTSSYWAYDDLDFKFRLKRNNIDSSWLMRLHLQEDSSYYYKIIY